METPVLSKKQQRLSMSGKKKKETIKNVLVTPYRNYWPLLTEPDADELNNILSQNLQLVKAKKVNVPWKDLQNVSKTERKEFRKKYDNSPLGEENKEMRTQMLFGVNQVTRALEGNKINCILISNQLTQQIIVKHVIDMSVLRNVPVLVLPNFQVVTSQTGVKGIILAFKNDVSHEKLLCVTKKIAELSSRYPIPQKHINYERSLINNKIKDLEADNTLLSEQLDDKMIVDDNENVSKEDETSSEEDYGRSVKKKLFDDKGVDKSKFYLYRSNNKQRIFVPKLSSASINVETPDISAQKIGNFLSFNDEDLAVDKKPYKSLTVKRVRNNPNREQQKLANLKKRRKT